MARRPSKTAPPRGTEEITFRQNRQVKDHEGVVIAEYKGGETYALPADTCAHFIRLGDAEPADEKDRSDPTPLVDPTPPGPTAQTPEVTKDEAAPEKPDAKPAAQPAGAGASKPRAKSGGSVGPDGTGSN